MGGGRVTINSMIPFLLLKEHVGFVFWKAVQQGLVPLWGDHSYFLLNLVVAALLVFLT